MADGLAAEPRLLLDPNSLSAEGTVALVDYQVSDDGRWVAYGLSIAGSDWLEWRVRDVATGKDTSDILRWIKFSSASWTTDSQGFYYSRYDEPREQSKLEDANYFQKLFYIEWDAAVEDRLVYHGPTKRPGAFVAW